MSCFGPPSALAKAFVFSRGQSSSDSPPAIRYDTLIFSAYPCQSSDLRNSSNSRSSVMPDMNMKRRLNVGDAPSKIACPPGSLHPRIAIQRDVLLLIAVHARHHDDSRYFATWLVAWSQMKDGGKLLATVQDLCPFNLMVGKLHEFREGLPLLRVIALDAVVDLIDRPHR